MGGFLSGLGTLLGGWNAARRIDDDGFDFREQDAAQQFERDRRTQVAGQQDEDWATKATTEAYLGAPEGTDIESLVPGQVADAVKRGGIANRARGAGLQARSSLAAQKSQDAAYLQNLKGDDTIRLEKVKGLNRLAQISAAGDEREAIVRLQEDLLNGREPNPRDKFFAAEAAKRAQTTGAMQGARLIPMENGEYGWLTRPSSPGERGTVTPTGVGMAPTATMRDTSGMAAGIQDSLQEMKDVAEKGVLNGPVVGRLSQWWQAAYPSGNEGQFDSAARRLVDIVYTKSGKQINQQELKILQGMIPTRSRGNVEFQIQEFERYADQLLNKYATLRQQGGFGVGGAGAGPRKRFNPTTGRIE